MMVVIGVIGLALALLLPALGTGSGRALEGSARQFGAELQNARTIAMAERTRTRVLIPVANAPTFAADLALRGFTTVSLNRTADTWKQRGRWSRLSQSAAFDPNPSVDPTKEEAIVNTRSAATTRVDNSASGIDATNTFTGPYVEFLANGASSLDPASLAQVIVVADATVDSSGTYTPKNRNMRYTLSIDPLSGSVRIR